MMKELVFTAVLIVTIFLLTSITSGQEQFPNVKIRIVSVEILEKVEVGKDLMAHTVTPTLGKKLIAVEVTAYGDVTFSQEQVVLLDPQGKSHRYIGVAAVGGAWLVSGGPIDLEKHDVIFTFKMDELTADLKPVEKAAVVSLVLARHGDPRRLRILFETDKSPKNLRLRFKDLEPKHIVPEGKEPDFAIQEEDFINRLLPATSGTDAKITDVAEGGLIVEGSVEINMGKPLMFAHGAKHTWISKVAYSGYTFESDKEDPLQFLVDSDRGYLYLKGKGTVTFPDGRTVKLPMSF